jgi:hypothetical protein
MIPKFGIKTADFLEKWSNHAVLSNEGLANEKGTAQHPHTVEACICG